MTISKRILLRIKELNAVRFFAGVDDNRKILGGVHIEAGNDTALLVATDGRAMAVMVATLEEPNEEPFKVTLPGDAVDSIARQCGKEATVTIQIHEGRVKITVGNERDAIEVRCEVMGQPYPRWREVMPSVRPLPAEKVILAPFYMERFAKAAKMLEASGGIQIGLDGGGGVMRVSIGGAPHFFGLWMPVRSEDAEFGIVPGWVEAGKVEADQAEEVQEPIFREPGFENQESIKLWDDDGVDSVLTVGRMGAEGGGAAMWYAALTLGVGTAGLVELLSLDLPCAKKRFDIIRRAAKRCKAWLVEKLGKDAAEGFFAKIDEAVEAHREREE